MWFMDRKCCGDGSIVQHHSTCVEVQGLEFNSHSKKNNNNKNQNQERKDCILVLVLVCFNAYINTYLCLSWHFPSDHQCNMLLYEFFYISLQSLQHCKSFECLCCTLKEGYLFVYQYHLHWFPCKNHSPYIDLLWTRW